jgi:hypothetical protein
MEAAAAIKIAKRAIHRTRRSGTLPPFLVARFRSLDVLRLTCGGRSPSYGSARPPRVADGCSAPVTRDVGMLPSRQPAEVHCDPRQLLAVRLHNDHARFLCDCVRSEYCFRLRPYDRQALVRIS